MDRRDNPEATDRHSDYALQKALKVILRSYQGGPPEELYREATGCFDTLIDISHGTSAVQDFAVKHVIDPKYLVDGANFLISRMHFNPESNYYVTLGIPRTASSDEIRERWKGLMLLYHPDRQDGDGVSVSERAKKVNEAYSILKDAAKRSEYDRKINEDLSLRSEYKPSIRKPLPRKYAGDRPQYAGLTGMKRHLTRILIGIYIVAAVIALIYIYIQNRSSDLEAELSPREKSLSGVPAVNPPQAFPRKSWDGESPVSGQMKSGDRARKRDAGMSVFPGYEQRKAVPQPAAPRSHVNPNASGRWDESGVKADSPEGRSSSGNMADYMVTSGPLERQQANLNDASNKGMTVNEVPTRGSGQRREFLTRGEVEDFIGKYSAAYEKGDLKEFMTFFSKNAVENNDLNYNAIADVYRKTFAEKIKSYKMKNIDIRIEGPRAFVSGVYSISRYISSKNRLAVYSGKIRWELVKEDNSLRIMYSLYDN